VQALQLVGFAMIPLSVFIVSVRGALALAQSPSGIFNDLLKIFLSFGSGATVIMSALVSSDSYQLLPDWTQKFLSSGDSSVESAALYSGSLDCLTNSTVGLDTFLLLVILPPAAILLASFVFIFAQQALRASCRPVKFYIVVVSLVLGNQFLSQMVGAAMRTLPCVHMQKDEGGVVRQFLSYQLEVDCKDRPASYLLATFGICAFALVCGPWYWWWILRRGKPAKAMASQSETEAAGEPPGEEMEDQGEEEGEEMKEEGEGGEGEEPEDEKAQRKHNNKQKTKYPSGEEVQDEGEGGEEHGHHNHGDDAVGFLVGNYRDGCSAWEALVLLRKIALAVASTLAPMSYSPGLHIILALVILMLSLVAHFYAQPFKKEKNMLNNVEGASLTVVNVAMVLTMYVTMDVWSATAFSKQVVTVLAGTLLIVWFWILVGLMVKAKWEEVSSRSPDQPSAADSAA